MSKLKFRNYFINEKENYQNQYIISTVLRTQTWVIKPLLLKQCKVGSTVAEGGLATSTKEPPRGLSSKPSGRIFERLGRSEKLRGQLVVLYMVDTSPVVTLE